MDYDYDYDYEDYEDYNPCGECPEVTLRNVIRKWIDRVKFWLRVRFSKEDQSDIPF